MSESGLPRTISRHQCRDVICIYLRLYQVTYLPDLRLYALWKSVLIQSRLSDFATILRIRTHS